MTRYIKRNSLEVDIHFGDAIFSRNWCKYFWSCNWILKKKGDGGPLPAQLSDSASVIAFKLLKKENNVHIGGKWSSTQAKWTRVLVG